MTDTPKPRRKTPVDHNPTALRLARIRRGLQQQELARLVNVVPSVLSEAEHGTRGISPAVRKRVAETLRCDPITFEPVEIAA